MKPICFYHVADLDGKCSAAIVHHALKGEVELIGIDYGWKFPWDKVQGREVIVVDFSLQPFSDMIRLKSEAKSLTWIDHHKSAILEYEQWADGLAKALGANPKIEGVREIGIAGCELTWMWFESHGLVKGPPPLAVKLLGRYDVWDEECKEFSWATQILPFQYGMRNRDHDPNADVWDVLLAPGGKDLVNIITAIGITILLYEDRQNALYVKVCAFPSYLDGRPVLACNKALANSRLFDSVWDPEKYHMMAAFYLQKRGTWKVSLYTTREDVDVSEVAKAHGGGGHKKAAGFIYPTCPFQCVQEPSKEPDGA